MKHPGRGYSQIMCSVHVADSNVPSSLCKRGRSHPPRLESCYTRNEERHHHMRPGKWATLLVCAIVAAGCAEELQVHEHVGSFVTGPSASSVANVAFVDRGRWTIFQLIDSSPAGDWPLPFRVELLDSRDRVLMSKTVDEAVAHSATSTKGHRKLTWRFDDQRLPFEANLDSDGNLPIDRVLKHGERYNLRFTLPGSYSHKYEVVVLSLRHAYPWQH